MKHSEYCPRPDSSFPCCEDQMCPCDRDAFEELESKLSQARNAFILIEKGSANRYPQPCFYDHDEINKIAREALKEIE